MRMYYAYAYDMVVHYYLLFRDFHSDKSALLQFHVSRPQNFNRHKNMIDRCHKTSFRISIKATRTERLI